uniref:Putative conserved secreted protein n=1 Tax=Ixodes ricinus TaxID=34613 RepID=A0A6B0UD66_IXORI
MILRKSALGACAVSAPDHVSCSPRHSTPDWLRWLVSFATVHLNGVEDQAHVVTRSASQQKARVSSYVGGFSTVVPCNLSPRAFARDELSDAESSRVQTIELFLP